ncbi:hypothetical protein KSZ_69570 [Dictyobacter formicarum]|uniref:Uncharacterized protein n=1 Tax=Dictyobacter formicarum TaxID=2778368 RepID=A0ABQ3VV31_9CHLR|nr:hypothetical protein KSZ_69570 [Dictyobacter formicarum]
MIVSVNSSSLLPPLEARSGVQGRQPLTWGPDLAVLPLPSAFSSPLEARSGVQGRQPLDWGTGGCAPIGANVSTIVLEQRKKEAKHGLSLVSLQKPKRDEGEKPCQADPIIRKNV